MANSVDLDQTAPIGAVGSGSTQFASILNLSVMFGNYLQQMTLAEDVFRYIFFLGALRVKCHTIRRIKHLCFYDIECSNFLKKKSIKCSKKHHMLSVFLNLFNKFNHVRSAMLNRLLAERSLV